MAVTKRFYLQNVTAPYSPATYRGAWDSSASVDDKKLGNVPYGAAATKGVAENSSNTSYDVMLARFVSDALGVGYTFTSSDTVEWVYGVLESAAGADMYNHIHIYVTTGDSDTVRGTLLTDNIGDSEWTTTATGDGDSTQALCSGGDVVCSAGDRIVVEIGYRATNTVTGGRTGTINYGNGGTTDLADADTNVTTKPGWVQFVTATMCFPEVVKSTSTWTCPTGIGTVKVEAWGGGGGGGGPAGGSGAGGGGGACSILNSYSVTPTTGYSVTVGTGGAGGNNENGSNGNDSNFVNSSTLLAKGGGYGECADNGATGGTGGASGSGVGDTKYSGGNGANGGQGVGGSQGGGGGGGAGNAANGGNTTTASGGTGGSVDGGNGGGGGPQNNSGGVGLPLAGGGGGSGAQIISPLVGGNGGNGAVIIYPIGLASSGTNMQINIGDTWKTVTAAQINIGDTWKPVTSAKINIGDAWKTIF